MKTNVLIIIHAFFFCFGATAQNANIPDANFKSFLVGNNSINTNMDSEIQMSEAEAYTGIIICSFLGITDMTGIEAFTNLTFLHCNDNSITTLDLSQNTALINLNFSNNNISTIDVSQNVNLTYLHGNNNNLTSLDLSQNTALVNVQFRQNNLNAIDVSQNTALTDLDFFDNNLSAIDISLNPVLEDLYLADNNLTTIDVSQNPALSRLTLTNNSLSTIDVSQNTMLTELSCNFNNLNDLDVSSNSNLSKLFCGNSNLSTLKLKNLSSSTMNVLNTNGNSNLTCIEVDDVAAATANITFLILDNWTSFSTSCSPIVNIPDANFKAYLVGNNSINTNSDAEIQVSEAEAYSGTINCYNQGINDLTGIEAFTTLTELYCHQNNLSTLDLSQNTVLTVLFSGDNNLTTLDLSQNTALINLNCDSYFNAGNLSTINISQNINLAFFQCIGSGLTMLDVSQNTALVHLNCIDNNLSTLDLSQNTALIEMYCNNNNLTELNLKNLNPSTSWMYASSNPNLFCIDVDDVAAATAAWTDIDPQTSFNENCNAISVTSISVQGQGGASTITTLGGALQMEANVLPMNADDASYTWSVVDGTGSATIDQSGLLTALTDGTVTVTATANDGSAVTGNAVITISNQSSSTIEESIFHNLSISPNPVNTQIFIDTEAKIEAITIIDVTGKTVKTIVGSNNTLDVSELSKGLYFLQFRIEETLVSKKMIKE